MKSLCLLASIFPLFGCSLNEKHHEVKNTMKTHYSQVNEPVHHKQSQELFIEKYRNKPITRSTASHPIKNIQRKNSAMLNVGILNQNPELKYGCEVTSLSMVLNYAGVHTNKMDLYRSIQKESDPLIRSSKGDVLHWGNPEHGFVGDMTGRRAGTTVFDKPMINLINQKLPGRAVNLTNQPFELVLNHVAAGYPVVVWTTLDYGFPKRWETWQHGQQTIKVPMDLHAVVLVGYDNQYVYLNDPLTVKKQVRVEKNRFISSWRALGSKAVSYR